MEPEAIIKYKAFVLRRDFDTSHSWVPQMDRCVGTVIEIINNYEGWGSEYYRQILPNNNLGWNFHRSVLKIFPNGIPDNFEHNYDPNP